MRRASALLLAALPAMACATLPESAGGGEGLPNAAAGPFRAITAPELGNSRSAPDALSDDTHGTRDGSILDLDGDPATLQVFGYFAANGVAGDAPPDRILRYGAIDGRSFDRAAAVALRAEEPWEEGTIGAPSAVRVGDEVWLYYAGGGGVGLARSADGKHFERAPGSTAPGLVLPGATNPGVVRLADGSFRMFFERATPRGPAIAEATSDDGLGWTIASDDALAPGDDYDAFGAGAPAPLLAKSATGRDIVRVYYTATDAKGKVTIGLAARFGDAGPLQRATAPVFGTANDLGPHQPSVVAFEGFTLLFATEAASASSDAPAIACGVAPGDVTLPTPRPR